MFSNGFSKEMTSSFYRREVFRSSNRLTPDDFDGEPLTLDNFAMYLVFFFSAFP